MTSPGILIAALVGAIAIILFCIIVLKLNAAIGMVIACLFMGLVGGLDLLTTASTISSGFGSMMTSIGLPVGFGTILGQLMSDSGAASVMADKLEAVECGYWQLYRYDPRLAAEGKNPFQLDSPEPDTSKLMDYLMGENRFASLKNNFPDRADGLYEKAVADIKARYAKYRRMADSAL